jgi:hypothetical protein
MMNVAVIMVAALQQMQKRVRMLKQIPIPADRYTEASCQECLWTMALERNPQKKGP